MIDDLAIFIIFLIEMLINETVNYIELNEKITKIFDINQQYVINNKSNNFNGANTIIIKSPLDKQLDISQQKIISNDSTSKFWMINNKSNLDYKNVKKCMFNKDFNFQDLNMKKNLIEDLKDIIV